MRGRVCGGGGDYNLAMAKTVMIMAGGALALWAGAAFALWRWQEKLLFFPSPTPAATARELADWAVEVAAEDGAILRGWQSPGSASAPPTDCKLLIYFGGNSEELSATAVEHSVRFACPQWHINYRGFGQSDGEPSERWLRDDALRVVDEAARRLHIAPEDICIMGRSLGTHMAAYVAAMRPIRRLILITPFDSALNVARGRYPIFPVRAMMRHPFDTLSFAPLIAAPTLFLLAEKDWIVPFKYSENLIRHWRAPSTTLNLPDSTHNQMQTPTYWRAIAHFMSPESEQDGGESFDIDSAVDG